MLLENRRNEGARWQLRSHPGGFGGRDSVAIRARFNAIRIAFTRFGLFGSIFAWVWHMDVRDSGQRTYPFYNIRRGERAQKHPRKEHDVCAGRVSRTLHRPGLQSSRTLICLGAYLPVDFPVSSALPWPAAFQNVPKTKFK